LIRSTFQRKNHALKLAVVLLATFAPAAPADTPIKLSSPFINEYKDRATIDVDDFVVDVAHKKANKPIDDGDLHVAGRSPTIGLAIVAEIMNRAIQSTRPNLNKSLPDHDVHFSRLGYYGRPVQVCAMQPRQLAACSS
jgi:hypothetical protein